MPKIRLIAWDEDAAAARCAELREAGLDVDAGVFRAGGLVAALSGFAAVCIDLDRLPSHGREVATAMRQTKALRHMPIVFAGGQRDKVAALKRVMPDAAYAEWRRVPAALRKAMRAPAANPVRPPAHMERYAGRPLAAKLGLAPGMTVTLHGAPAGFLDAFDEVKQAPGAGVAFWFVRSRAELAREMEWMAARIPAGGSLWIIYPKKAARIRADFTQNDVRETAIAAGLVDYKVCAIDADWTGLKFARKSARRA